MAFVTAIVSGIGSLFSGFGGVGSLLGAAGTVLSGVTAMQQARYQAKVAENNAKIAEENAQLASQTAQQEAMQNDEEIATFIGQQEAIQSASGLSTSGKSQVLTRRAAARIGRQDSENIRRQGEYNVRGLQQEAANFRSDAKAAKASGTAALVGGILGGASSLVGSAKPSNSPFYRAPAPKRKADPWAGLRVRTV